jgi:pyoverdine/dityrosine biosynthesis protein Dit1/AcrR family transcriptional regulator
MSEKQTMFVFVLKTNLIQYELCETAAGLFLEKGYENVRLKEIAGAAGIAEKDAYKYFGSKEDIILFLYQRIHADWEIFVSSLTETKLSLRFEKALVKKIELIAPYTDLLNEMMSLLLRNSKLGINSPRTQHIRAKGIRLMQTLAEGSDSWFLKKRVKNLPVLLYLLHWSVLFLHVQSADPEKTKEIISHLSNLLKRGDNLLFLLPLLPFIKELTAFSELILTEKPEAPGEAAKQILKVLFNHRKISYPDQGCAETGCEKCLEKHLAKINYFISLDQPIHFILPAFPAKSPNQRKVLGELPDLGEETALITLENMCREITDVYPPGAKVTICSDGRIFADLVGVPDEKVTRYADALKEMIELLKLKNIDFVNLEDLQPGQNFDEARDLVMANYAEPFEILPGKVKTNDEFRQLFNGIHRFISEDRMFLETEKSKTKVKEESKIIALKVIQHSNAWTRFLVSYFPESVRLSIHPYSSHADKIGIRLTKATDDWLTPWHGVMVLTEAGYLLMKKEEAEKQGAKLVFKDQQPYYYKLISSNE